MKKQPIDFHCYPTVDNSGAYTIFQFFPNGLWDEDKLTITEAITKYPLYKYEWIKIK